MTTTSSMRIESRADVGRSACQIMRQKGMVPGIIYGGDTENVKFAVDERDINKGLTQSGFYTKIFTFDVNGVTERTLCKDVQFHPVTDRPIHVDFMRVTSQTKVHVNIPIKFLNESECPGLKVGGILNIVLHSLEVICTVDHIPEQLTVDLKGLEIGTSIHLTDLELPISVVAAHPDRDQTVATIAPPADEETDKKPE